MRLLHCSSCFFLRRLRDQMNYQKRENPFINIFANILIPVFILNKTSWFPGDNKALWALIVALAFPMAYGLWDLIQNSKINYFSLFGLLSTLITGLLALFQLGGIWFAIKEAALPALLGIGTYFTSISGKPFFRDFIISSGLLQINKINEKAEERQKEEEVQKAFVASNNLFSVSFFISAILNFALAIYIFSPISSELSAAEKSEVLNSQVSQMIWAGMLVIGLPMVFFLMFTVLKLLKDLEKITGLNKEELTHLSS